MRYANSLSESKISSFFQQVRRIREFLQRAPQPSASTTFQLQQIPFVPIEILKHGNRSIRLITRRPAEVHPARCHGAVVAPEIIRVQEQENASKKDSSAALGMTKA